MLTDETIEANIESIFTVFDKLLTFGDGPTDAVMVNNHDWLGKLGYIELLQEVGTHFTINRMLSFDSVAVTAGARATDDLPRIQLHDPSRLRFQALVART